MVARFGADRGERYQAAAERMRKGPAG
jgi:hypothetical protein